MQAAKVFHTEAEHAAMNDVTSKWAESISPDLVTPPIPQGTGGQSSHRALIEQKLERTVIDKVNFDKLDISTVIQYLQDKSKELDPDHEGINFVLRLSLNTPPPNQATPTPGQAPAAPVVPPNIHREVSIQLENVPLSELLNYITEQTNLQFTVEDYAVYLRPSIDEGETLTPRTFLVPPNFFQGSAIHVTAPSDTGSSTVMSVAVPVQQELASRGISFPNGATAVFLPGSSKLVVRNTPEQLDLIANMIETQSRPQPQVEIEAKLAEFNQTAIKALTFNYYLGLDAIAGVNGAGALGPFTSFGGQTGLRNSNYLGVGNGGITPNSIDSLINENPGISSTTSSTYPIAGTLNTSGSGPLIQLNPIISPDSPASPNELVVGAVINNTGMAAMIDAINNTQGVELVTAPNVTTRAA